MTPTARSLAVLREMGYTAEVVEHWNSYSKTRKDLFGWIDILAMHPDHGFLGIQACTRGDAAKRLRKALSCPQSRLWLQAGGRGEVWSWAKQGPAGSRKVWTLKREPLEVDGEG